MVNTMEKVIPKLPVDALQQIAGYLKWDPYVTYPTRFSNDNASHGRLLSSMPQPEQRAWLDTHRTEIMKEISSVGGHSVVNLFRGGGVSYRQIIANAASKLDLGYDTSSSIEQLEAKIVSKLWSNVIATLTPEQRRELEIRAEEEAKKFGKTIKGELSGFGALGAAQISGFGVYMLGSTLLGAINGALGLVLGFGVFTGLSSLISIVICPAGWSALGVFTVFRLGRPNYKKLLPVVILIAVRRNDSAMAQTRTA